MLDQNDIGHSFDLTNADHGEIIGRSDLSAETAVAVDIGNFDCFGTVGTAGTAGGTLGTAGSLGCCC